MSGNTAVLDPPKRRHGGASSGASRPPCQLAEPCAAAALPLPARPAWRQVALDLLELTKPRIVVMILVTAGVAALVAAGPALAPLVLVHLLLGTAAVAASAGVLNQYLESALDGRMPRTSRRPLPGGRIASPVALLWGGSLLAAGSGYLALTVGAAPAGLGLLTWLTYLAIYTPLKTRSAWNTSVGAVAGALPTLMGYTAAGGRLDEPAGWLLFAVLVAWQFPHFMAIAWMYRKQYGAAGVRMTTVVEPSGRSAGWQSVAGAVLLPVVLVALVASSAWGLPLAAAIVFVSSGLVRAAVRFQQSPDDATARRMLRSSLLQLPAAMGVLVVAALVG